MSDTAIRVESLSKQYRICGSQGRFQYKSLRESLVNAVQAPFRRAAGLLKGRAYGAAGLDETIWALKDVSFEVKGGEVVGIIGRNGAGKTTLLKILSRITEPTEGRAEIQGRVGSLLEVGTGFHPELTGRENIYLNGAILGMKKAEIERKFDEIVDFAEIEKFLDTPVKHYSSGMYVRLAFAVAAHLEPEILLVDEVLAVGDMAFQKKCLGRMGEVAKEGRTVLFVSHNMAAIQSMCRRAVVLDAGSIQYDSYANDAISKYLVSLKHLSKMLLSERSDGHRSKMCRFSSIWFANKQGERITKAMSGQPVDLCLEYETELADRRLVLAFGLYGMFGQPLAYCSTAFSSRDFDAMPSQGVVVCSFPRLPLLPGQYTVNIALHLEGRRVDHVEAAATLDVEPGDFYGTGRIPIGSNAPILLDHSWKLL